MDYLNEKKEAINIVWINRNGKGPYLERARCNGLICTHKGRVWIVADDFEGALLLPEYIKNKDDAKCFTAWMDSSFSEGVEEGLILKAKEFRKCMTVPSDVAGISRSTIESI